MQQASGGEIVIELLEPGKVADALGILDAVSEGKVDAGVTSGGFYVDKIPAGPIFSSIPFGPEADEYLAWLFHGNGLKLDQEMYDQAGYNIKVLPYSVSVPEASGWFSKPINSGLVLVAATFDLTPFPVLVSITWPTITACLSGR